MFTPTSWAPSDCRKARHLDLKAAVAKHFAGNLEDRRIAVWGVPDTERVDVWNCLQWLIDSGADIVLYDDNNHSPLPVSIASRLSVCESRWEAASGAEALIVANAGRSCGCIDAGRLRWHIADPVIFDADGSLDMDSLQYSSFVYVSCFPQMLAGAC